MQLKKVINLYGGPGCGKSYISYALMAQLKRQYMDVEFCNEVAKEYTAQERWNTLASHQLTIFKEQHEKLFFYRNKTDYVVTDASLLIPLSYYNEDIYPYKEFADFVLATHNEYPNIEIFLERNPKYLYQQSGRKQNLEQAKDKDKVMKHVLDDLGIEYHTMMSDDDTVDKIISLMLDDEI